MNRRVGVIVGALLLVIVASAGGYYVAKNPESRSLNDAARQSAPGKFVRLTDGMTHYRFDGPDSGRVIVLAHGFSVPLYIWDSTAASLAKAGYRVLRYDAYGRGYSDRPRIAYTDQVFDRQVVELLDSLHINGKVDVGGVSAGGYVMGIFAGRHPDCVRSLLLVDPVAGKSNAAMHPFDYSGVGEYLWQTQAMPGMAEGQMTDFIDASRFPDWIHRYKAQMEMKGFGHALWSSRMERRGLDTDTIYRRVADAHIPVLLVWGEKDQTVPFKANELVRKAIPSAEFHPIANAAHLPILERAAVTDSIIKSFLASHR